jgi:hypothetical protein
MISALDHPHFARWRATTDWTSNKCPRRGPNNSGDSEETEHNGRASGAYSDAHDPDLIAIVAAWPMQPAAVLAQSVAIVEAAALRGASERKIT